MILVIFPRKIKVFVIFGEKVIKWRVHYKVILRVVKIEKMENDPLQLSTEEYVCNHNVDFSYFRELFVCTTFQTTLSNLMKTMTQLMMVWIVLYIYFSLSIFPVLKSFSKGYLTRQKVVGDLPLVKIPFFTFLIRLRVPKVKNSNPRRVNFWGKFFNVSNIQCHYVSHFVIIIPR